MAGDNVVTRMGTFVGHMSTVWELSRWPQKLFHRDVSVTIMGRPPGEKELAALERFFAEQDRFKGPIADVVRFGPLSGYQDPDKLFARCDKLSVSLAEEDDVDGDVDIYVAVYQTRDDETVDVTVRNFSEVFM
jgi:hypothetical protein